MKPRKIPLRKCVGCQEMKDKRTLIRVVRAVSDESPGFSLDFTGKKPGRGAYVCPDISCLDKAFKQKGLERSFRQPVPREVYEQLKSELNAPPKGQ